MKINQNIRMPEEQEEGNTFDRCIGRVQQKKKHDLSKKLNAVHVSCAGGIVTAGSRGCKECLRSSFIGYQTRPR